MKSKLGILKLAQSIQDKSSSNVNVSVDLALGGFGTEWGVRVMVVTPQGEIGTYLSFDPYSNINQLELLAKHGYNSYTAAL